ncbi:MAG: hypothetical protein J6W52_06795 [Bacteroidaceae bacterium]|nr:hypothetical protein [Bacteroidaceae bacterium]
MAETDYFKEPLWDVQAAADIAEQLLPMLNYVIQQHNLTSTDVLASLAQLSAAHIHIVQGFFDNPDQKDAVESVYNKMLQHYLAAFDANDIQREMEKIKREKMN